MSFTKPEVHSVLHCRRKTTEPRPQVTCTENFAKFVYVSFLSYASGQRHTDKPTDRHADTLIAILRTLTEGEVKRTHRIKYIII